MYKKYLVNIPTAPGKITKKTIKNTIYVYYQYNQTYKKEARYYVPQRACIGKLDTNSEDKMYPNDNYEKYFPKEAYMEEPVFSCHRSGCLNAGTYVIIDKIVKKHGIKQWLMNEFGEKDGALILDLASYLIIAEQNSAQHYPDYAFNHPLFTADMKIYSDSKVGMLLKEGINIDSILNFTQWWNDKRDHRKRAYVYYDSTNKVSHAGNISIVEPGHSKTGMNGEQIVNISVGMDVTSKLPLYYEEYSGSIVDVSQLEYMIEKAESLGYKKMGFILDRGYFSKHNMTFMKEKGCPFIIMCKGNKALVSSLILQNKGKFETKYKNSIAQYDVFGTTVEAKLFADDKENKYFHLFFSQSKAAEEIENINSEMRKYREELERRVQKDCSESDLSTYEEYFELAYKTENRKKFLISFKEKEDVIEQLYQLAGYFCIISSEQMGFKDALLLYKSRDGMEKLFSADKTFLGGRSERIYSDPSLRSKLFIQFIALIIRSSIYAEIYNYINANVRSKRNYHNVKSFISEMEKIQIIRFNSQAGYVLDHPITARQKDLLRIFGMDLDQMVNSCTKLCGTVSAIYQKEKLTLEKDKDIRDDSTIEEESEKELCLD